MKHKITNGDKLIKKLLKNPDYLVLWSGEIMTRRDLGGHVQDTWRTCLVKHKGSRSLCSYWRVRFEGKLLQAHRIVFQKFLGELNDEMHINHKDGDGLNNCVENLELVTPSENNIHRYRVLGRAPVIGHSKINQAIASQIRADRAKGLPYKALCEKYGLVKGTISGIINGKNWKAS